MKNYTAPPPLKPGDTIGICAPAGAVNAAEMEAMYIQIKQWGYNYKVGKNVGKSYFKFSGTDDDRLQELQEMMDDPAIAAIFFARGGYGLVRIVDRLDFTKFTQKPKWMLGYSDITCLHSHLHSNYNIGSLHGHMATAYKAENHHQGSTDSILAALTGCLHDYKTAPHALNNLGEARGAMVGGNLALLSDLIGTPSDLDTAGKILFIEEIGEYYYNIDRMMWQLLRSGKLDKLAGLVVGSFNDTQDNEIPFGKTVHEIVHEKVHHFTYPVCYDFPIGHQAHNLTIKIGATYTLDVREKEVRLFEKTADTSL